MVKSTVLHDLLTSFTIAGGIKDTVVYKIDREMWWCEVFTNHLRNA